MIACYDGTATIDSNVADTNFTATAPTSSSGSWWIAPMDFTVSLLNDFARIDQLIRSRNWRSAPREIKPRISAPGEKRVLFSRFMSRDWTGFNFCKQH